MKDLKDQSIGMSINQKKKQKKQILTVLTEFPLMLLFKELTDYLFLLLMMLIIILIGGSHRKYFLPRVNITNYNVLIDGRNFYDQPISDQIKTYDEISKIETRKRDDYTTGCLLDYQYFKDHY